MALSLERRGVVVALFLSALTLDARNALAGCANDAACKGDRICEKGYCVVPPKSAPAPAPAPAPPPTALVAPEAAAAPPPPSAPLAPPAGSPAAAAGGAAPPANAVQVDFEGVKNETLRVEGTAGSGSCRAPCGLQLAPGSYTLRSKSFAERIDIPNHATTVSLKKGCTACFIVGGILTGVAIPFMAGGWALHKGEETDAYTSGGVLYTTGEDGASAAGLGMFIGGVIFALSGVTLLIVGGAAGGSSVTVEGKAAPGPSAKPAGLALTGHGVGLRF